MEDRKREQEREELHRTIWNIANDLRGSVDGWDFKQYVLGMLFYRYISENFSNYINQGEWEAGEEGFDYACLPDEEAEGAREELIETKGFFIFPSQLFSNVRARAPQDENLNETLDAVFRSIEDSAKGSASEDDLKGLFDDIDVNSNKLGGTVAERNKRLVKLMNGIGDMKLGGYEDNAIDAFGDAYEYLMGMYASNAGKSGGEYFTPQEVSELLTHIAIDGKEEINKIYDPACGSGSLLLKAAKILGRDKVRQGFFGQEINITTYNLCRINMFLHNIDYDKFDIAHGDTLTEPMHWDEEPFEAIVSNPPYSIKWEGDNNATLFIDASKECVKITNSNKLTQENIQHILTTYQERTDKDHVAKLVPNDQIAEQDYNLSVSTYVEQEDTREVIDIVKLNAEIEEIVAREQVLREEIQKIVMEIGEL